MFYKKVANYLSLVIYIYIFRIYIFFVSICVTDVAMPVRAVCKTSLSWPQKEAL